MLASLGLFGIATLLQSLAIIYANNRLVGRPRQPCPDLCLEHLPYHPWAFRFSEVVIFLEGLCCLTVMDWDLAEKLIAVWSRVLLIRSLLLVTTGLPVPDHRFNPEKLGGSWFETFKAAGRIILGMGLTLTGVYVCGDYALSGHTASLTLLELAAEGSYPILIPILWILGIVGVLISHEHYTLDIIVGWFITRALWLEV